MKEFIDFLGSQPPYDRLSADDLRRLAGALEVEFFTAGTVVVPDGAPPLTSMYVIRTGAVEIVDRGRVVDLLGTGDTFGHVSLLSGLPPALEVRTAEDTLAYRLPDPRTVLEHPDRLRFHHYGTMVTRERLTRTAVHDAVRHPVRQLMRPVVWVSGTATVRDAAARIEDAGQSCAVVRLPDGYGIVTDHDFRRLWRREDVTATLPAAAFCSTPVLTVPDDTPVLDAFLEMVEHGVHHLVVVSPDDVPVGVVRVVDLASADVRDPLFVRGALEGATSPEALRDAASLVPATVVELSDNGVPPMHVAALLSAVRDQILRRLVEFFPFPAEGEVSWLVLGSLARREALPASDVDTGLVWSGLPASLDRPATERLVTGHAERVLSALERCGIQRCPDGANAANLLFNRSVADWAGAATRWAQHPTASGALLLASIVADSRPVTGLPLGRRVTESMLGASRQSSFLDALLGFTVAVKPPAGFVRDFVVEHSGVHRGRLDLKRGGLRPVAALGRWIAVVTGDTRGATTDRVRRGVPAGLLTQDEADALVGAYEQIYKLRFEREVADIRSGTLSDSYVAPRDLDSLTRRYLRESFRAVVDVQGQVYSRWMSRP